jgi:hypothetical protein
MGDAAGMTHVCGMTHDDGDGMTDDADAEMFYNDNGISALSHSNNSDSPNRMGVVNKTLP